MNMIYRLLISLPSKMGIKYANNQFIMHDLQLKVSFEMGPCPGKHGPGAWRWSMALTGQELCQAQVEES